MNPGKLILMALSAFGAVAGGVAPASAQDGPNIYIVGGRAGDPFFAKVKRGIEDATMVVEAHGGSVTYLPLQTYDNIGADAANLIRTGISQGADGIAAPNWVPSAEDSAFRAAVDAGIPVVVYNSGGWEKAEELGGINYVGNIEYTAGLAGGRYFGEHGATNVLCVNTVPGAQNLEDRCKGIADGISESGGASSQLPLPATSFGDPTAVAEAIKAKLLQDSEIDGLVAISAGDANSAANGILQAGASERIMLGAFDMDSTGLSRIEEGTQAFAIDQQPYLQGFLAIFLLDAYLNYALDSPSKPILTGPAIVDSSNVESTLKGVEAGAR